MSKRLRHPPGFYASLLNDVHERGCSLKCRPKAKPTVMGVYEFERIVAKRAQGRKEEYFIQWKNYSPTENTWEPVEHLPKDLITTFESRYVDPLRVDECTERLALLFESGLKAPLAYSETITMRHDVLRSLFPDMPLDLRGTPYLASQEGLLQAGLGSFLRRSLTVTGAGCILDAPVVFKSGSSCSSASRLLSGTN